MSNEEEKKDIAIETGLVPDKPDICRVTRHAEVNLSWRIPPVSYCLQQNVEESDTFETVYEGDQLQYTCPGRPATCYQYRLKVVFGGVSSQWSNVVTVKTTGYSESTPGRLYEAINNNNYLTVESLLQKEPDCVNAPSNIGSPPLMEACKIGNERIVNSLLKGGADVEYCDGTGKTSLMEACYNGCNECVLLLESEASLRQFDKMGRSVLHWAAIGEHLDTVKLLLGKGLPADIVDRSRYLGDNFAGNTPLLSLAASNHGNADIARELISWGADVNWRNAKGQTPLKLACSGHHRDLVNLLYVENNCDRHGLTTLDNAFCLEVQGNTELADAIVKAVSAVENQL